MRLKSRIITNRGHRSGRTDFDNACDRGPDRAIAGLDSMDDVQATKAPQSRYPCHVVKRRLVSWQVNPETPWPTLTFPLLLMLSSSAVETSCLLDRPSSSSHRRHRTTSSSCRQHRTSCWSEQPLFWHSPFSQSRRTTFPHVRSNHSLSLCTMSPSTLESRHGELW